jgi:hypothetical protein
MAHFAEIDENNIVIRVLVVSEDKENIGEKFLSEDLGLGGTWKKTSYNTHNGNHLLGGTPFRKNYAGVGYSYDESRDAFIPPKKFESWILDEESCNWIPPFEAPVEEGKIFVWDEDTTSWIETVPEE